MLNSLDSRSSRKTSSVRSSTDTPRNSQRDSSPVVPAQKRKVSYHTSSNENFKVVIRARPPLARELNGDRPFQNIVEVDADEQVITVSENLAALATGSPHNSATLAEKGPYSTHIFTFDYVYDQNASQEKVYATTAKSVVDSSLEGYNATIFAYGQTGTGKTYTMEGYQSDQDIQHRGLIPRAIEQIFGHIQRNASPRMRFLVRASYLQIYNEVISDLLKPERNNLAIREDPRRGVFVEGLSEWVVRSPAEIYGLMERGATVRATGATNMNEASSRSHAVFIIIAEQSSTFYVDQSGNEINFEEFTEMMNKQSNRGDAMKKMDDHVRQTFKVGKLNLVDLAGSERVRLSGATGVRLTESRKINQSLSALGNVIAALTDVKGRQHIPYRDSKLTRILEDSLGGNCKTTMMAMISPALESMVETVSTLKFANRAKNIKNEPKVNEDLDQKSLLRKYERELRRLRAELDERSRNVVDKRRLLELDEQRRRAERDKMAAIRALEQRSLEFLREKEEKRKLEERILMLTSQIRMGGNDKASEGDSDQLTLLMKAEQERIRHEYEARLQEIEKERETIEEEKAQVDRYKQLLLKQRDIMIALTQRLNERDEQIMALQDEVDAYDRHNRELEEKLDAKTAQLIHLQRVTLEAAATSPVKNSNLDLALGAWAEEDGPRCPTPQESAGFQELDFHSVSAPGPPVSPHMLITFPQFQRYQPESFMVEGHEASLPGDADLLNAQDKIQELTGIISQYRSEMERMVKDNEDVKAEKVSMEFLLREKLEQLVQSEIEARLSEFRKEQSSMDTPALQKVVENQRNQLKLKHDEVQSLAQQLEFERNQLKQLKVQLSGAEPKGENKELINLQERCEILSNERRALHSILDQKIRVLVEGVGVYFKDLDPVENSIAAQAKNSFKNLRRIVEASVNALREAETADKKRVAQDTLAAQTKLSQTAIMTSSSKVDETAPIGKLPTSFSEDFHPEK